MKRIEVNDPVALREKGIMKQEKGDYSVAFDYLTKAAELGDAGAHYQLSCMYHEGKGVEKDVKKKICHLIVAAIGGHPAARYNLALYEGCKGDTERDVSATLVG